jgi:predicted nucleic acid-binding protein
LNLKSELAGINSIFLDTAPIIYYIEAHPQYGPLMKDIVDSFKFGIFEAYTSVITITEVLPKPVSQNKTYLVETFMRFLKNEANLNLLSISPDIAQSAGHLKAKYNSLRTMDALQLSSAIKADVDISLPTISN